MIRLNKLRTLFGFDFAEIVFKKCSRLCGHGPVKSCLALYVHAVLVSATVRPMGLKDVVRIKGF